MNSIERVKAAIHFQKPDRVPVWKAGPADVLPLLMVPSGSWRPGFAPHEQGLFPFTGDDKLIKYRLWKWKRPDWATKKESRNFLTLPREEVDEWGVIWKREGENASMGHPGRPAIADWADYEKYLVRYSPRADDKSRYSLALFYNRLVGRSRYRMAILGFQGPFTIASALRGFENFMADHYMFPEQLNDLLHRITKFYIEAARCWVKFGADPHGFVIYDDLADQHRPFISVRMFREFYEPVFKAIFEAIHELGCEAHFHSCGNVTPLLPTLIEWGVDAMQFDSPRMNGYENLELFRGKLMMWGDVNIQTIYVSGTPQEVEREVWHMVRNLGTPEGGFGAYFYPQTDHIKVPRANIKAFRSGVDKYGVYSNIPSHWWTHPVPEKWDERVVPPLPDDDF